MQFWQQVLDGLSSGSIYAALALALVLVHRATGVVNFAQGEMAVLSAYIAWTLSALGVPILWAVALSVVVSMPIGAATERLVIRRFQRSGQGLETIAVTVGLLLCIHGLIAVLWGLVVRPFPHLFSRDVLRYGDLAVSHATVGNLAVLLVVIVGLQLVFFRTRFGLMLRAVADNRDSSALAGLPVGALLMAGWGLAASLGALAACMIAPKVYLEPHMMSTILVYALAAAILGGLDSPMGAVAAALFIGVSENLAASYLAFIGSDLKIAVPLLLMTLVLLVKPQGVFGSPPAVRV